MESKWIAAYLGQPAGNAKPQLLAFVALSCNAFKAMLDGQQKSCTPPLPLPISSNPGMAQLPTWDGSVP